MNSRLYLTVPYVEKDAAKALGARWDVVARRWFVPEGLAEADFMRWLPTTQLSTDAAVHQQLNTLDAASLSDKGISLSTLMAQANHALKMALPSKIWVMAEITELSQHNGHLYLTLAESKQGQQLAQARATIWSGQRTQLLTQFEQVTGQQLVVGMSVLVAVEISVHARFGLSLLIIDINPSFTLGDQEAKLSQIRQQLNNQGLYRLNKQLPFPRDLFRIAVLAPAQAAGLGDFRSDANQLAELALCQFDYFYASFQGVNTVIEMTQALQQVIKAHSIDPYDLLVIIRGGGARQDLLFLNEFELAAAIAQCPIPVMTGIGHERDMTILDEVAHTRLDTPSKTIAYIRQHIVDRALQSKAHWQAICQHSRQRLNHERLVLTQHRFSVREQSQQHLSVARQRLEAYYLTCQQSARYTVQANLQRLVYWYQQLCFTAQQLCRLQQQQLDRWQVVLLPSALQQLQQQKTALVYHHQLLQTMHPNRLLQQGYLWAVDAQGKAIRSAQQAATCPTLTLTFHDGNLLVQPLSVTLQKNDKDS